jgi:hypothetical protein
MGRGSEPGGWWQDEKGKWRQGGRPDTPLLGGASSPPALARRPRRVPELLGVLIFHGFGALTWFAFLGFSSDAGTDRQLNEALRFGAATWLVAALLIAWLWLSGRSPWFWGVPVVWWFPSFLLMIAVVYGWNSDLQSPRAAVYATATFEESADCLHYWHGSEGWGLGDFNVAHCFPTQTAAKKEALIVCFNKYERNHPDHNGWPEDNMRGCTWDGLTAVPAHNVASLAFGNVVAVPATPRAGKLFVLRVGVTRSDSAAKVVHTALIDSWPVVNVAVKIDGEKVAIKSVGAPDVTGSEYWFFDSKIRMKFTVPKTGEGKRLAIKMTAAQSDTPTATKVVTFTVGP